MSEKELETISLDFRRISSNLLSSNDENADVNLYRLMNFIEKTPFIHDCIHNIVDHIEFDFQSCFTNDSGWARMNIPVDENCHIKIIYDYMWYILDNSEGNIFKKGKVLKHAMQYPWGSRRSPTDIIQAFLKNIVKPMIDFINNEISKKMILLEEEEKNAQTMALTINTFHGNVNGGVIQQGHSSVANTKNGISATELNTLIERLVSSLAAIKDVDSETIESVKDDLESLQEQIHAPTPRKSRMQRALAGIKTFAVEFSSNLAVSLASNVITGADWTALIKQTEQFIDGLTS